VRAEKQFTHDPLKKALLPNLVDFLSLTYWCIALGHIHIDQSKFEAVKSHGKLFSGLGEQ
jgi:hypothetical protein